MSNKLQPRWETIVASQTVAADTQLPASPYYDLPYADTYTLVISSGIGTGTSPTLDISMQISPDGGTTWVTAPIRSTQRSTAALTDVIVFKPRLGDNEVAYGAPTALTGGVLAKNFVPTRKVRFYFELGGTNPSFPTCSIMIGMV